MTTTRMRIALFPVVCLLLLACGAEPSGPATLASHKLIGALRDQAGLPVAGEVQLAFPDRTNRRLFTDTSGRFQVALPGPKVLVVAYNGESLSDVHAIDLTESGANVEVSIRLSHNWDDHAEVAIVRAAEDLSSERDAVGVQRSALSAWQVGCATSTFLWFYNSHDHCVTACNLVRWCFLLPWEIEAFGGMLEFFSYVTGLGVADLQDIIDNTRGIGCGYSLQSCSDCCH